MSYTDLLASLERVRALTTVYELNLPQITVIGDQSSGKSSLLTELSGIPFPVNNEITTRCPIVVSTKNANDTAYYITYDWDDDAASDVDDDTASVLSNTSVYSFMSVADELVEHDKLGEKILSLQKQNCGKSKVSNRAIKIRAEGPNLKDLVLVDLPGIMHNGDGKEDVVKMINKYISPQQSLILVITEATRDNETHQALELAKKVDPGGERTMRVLTKFDVFDNPKNKSRAEKLIREGTGAYRPHAVICRSGGEKYNSTEEDMVLDSLASAGVQSLKDRLPDLLCKLIRTNLPGLKKQVNILLKESQQVIERIGKFPPDSTTILLAVEEQLSGDLQTEISTYMDTFRNEVHDTGPSITSEWVNESYKHDAFACIFFQGGKTFDICIRKYLDLWVPILDRLERSIEECLESYLPEITGISSTLRTTIEESWNMYCATIMDTLRTEFKNELKKEERFKTMNHYLTAKYKENMIVPDEVLEEIEKSITKDIYATHPNTQYETPRPLDKVRESVIDLIKKALETRALQFERDDLSSQHKQRVLAAVKANWSVSHKNLCDNILSNVLTTVIDGKNIWLRQVLLQDPRIKKDAVEDAEIRKTRKEHLERIEKMKNCKKELEEY